MFEHLPGRNRDDIKHCSQHVSHIRNKNFDLLAATVMKTRGEFVGSKLNLLNGVKIMWNALLRLYRRYQAGIYASCYREKESYLEFILCINFSP